MDEVTADCLLSGDTCGVDDALGLLVIRAINLRFS
jgi:hypothetical protein